MNDLKMKETNILSSSEGVSTFTHSLKTLLAAFNHREWERGPSSRTDKSTGKLPDFIAELICSRLLLIFV